MKLVLNGVLLLTATGRNPFDEVLFGNQDLTLTRDTNNSGAETDYARTLQLCLGLCLKDQGPDRSLCKSWIALGGLADRQKNRRWGRRRRWQRLQDLTVAVFLGVFDRAGFFHGHFSFHFLWLTDVHCRPQSSLVHGKEPGELSIGLCGSGKFWGVSSLENSSHAGLV